MSTGAQSLPIQAKHLSGCRAVSAAVLHEWQLHKLGYHHMLILDWINIRGLRGYSRCHCGAAACRPEPVFCVTSGMRQVRLQGLIDAHASLSPSELSRLPFISQRNDDERIAAASIDLSDKPTTVVTVHLC